MADDRKPKSVGKKIFNYGLFSTNFQSKHKRSPILGITVHGYEALPIKHAELLN